MREMLGKMIAKIFRAVYYARKTFNEVQKNYSATKKEMLAMVFACEKFKPYILGSDGKERCKTNTNEMSFIVARFLLRDQYKKGSDNVIADHLSWIEKLDEEK